MSTLASHDRPRRTFDPRDWLGRLMHDALVKLAVLCATLVPLAIVNTIHEGARVVGDDLVLLGAAVGAAVLIYRTIVKPVLAAGKHIESIPSLAAGQEEIKLRLGNIEDKLETELGIVADDLSGSR